MYCYISAQRSLKQGCGSGSEFWKRSDSDPVWIYRFKKKNYKIRLYSLILFPVSLKRLNVLHTILNDDPFSLFRYLFLIHYIITAFLLLPVNNTNARKERQHLIGTFFQERLMLVLRRRIRFRSRSGRKIAAPNPNPTEFYPLF